jgi:hypothetical protein
MATEEDRIDAGVLLTIGSVLTVSVLGVALAVTALVRSESDELTAEKGATANLRPIQELDKLQAAELEKPPTWFDRDAGLVTLALSRARTLMLEDIKKDPNKATWPAPPPPDAGAKPAPVVEAADGGAEGGEAPEQPTGAADGGAAPKAPEEGPEAPETPEPEAP